MNFIDTKTFQAFWANTSANSLVGKLIREAGHSIKEQFELLLHGESIRSEKIDSLLTLVIPVIIPRSNHGFVLNVELNRLLVKHTS